MERRGPLSFGVEFESEEELRAEERTNLAAGGLFLRTSEALPPFASIELVLGLAGGRESVLKASVVGNPPGALALHLEGDPAAIVAALLPLPVATAKEPAGDIGEAEVAASGTLWDRLRAMTPPQKMLLAPKAERALRALMIQDSDPMLLFSLLKNPRLGLDEVVRIAKSSYLGFQAAELILKTPQWSGNLDVRVALIHNPKLPLPIALRILPSLPDNEVRTIAKGAATSSALKQAALRKVIGSG
ncbi:MAG: hypothetical protein ABI609_08255 [Acidobacteriota bacterium]